MEVGTVVNATQKKLTSAVGNNHFVTYKTLVAAINKQISGGMINLDSIPDRVKPKTPKTLRLFTDSLHDVQQLQGQCEASNVCGRQVVVVVLPDPFRGMGARRNSAETQQSGHTPRSGP